MRRGKGAASGTSEAPRRRLASLRLPTRSALAGPGERRLGRVLIRRPTRREHLYRAGVLRGSGLRCLPSVQSGKNMPTRPGGPRSPPSWGRRAFSCLAGSQTLWHNRPPRRADAGRDAGPFRCPVSADHPGPAVGCAPRGRTRGPRRTAPDPLQVGIEAHSRHKKITHLRYASGPATVLHSCQR